MAAQIFPYGTALTVVWHLSKPDGTDFDITGYTYRVYYRTGNKETEANGSHVTASANTISIVIPATEPSAPGEYALRLVLYQNNKLFCTLNYNGAFVLSRRLAQDLAMETQQEEVQIVHLYTVAEFYLFTPIIPTVGSDGYWYVNGTKVTDGHGEFVPSSHTMEYDAQTNYIIIDRDRVDSQGHSIAQTITSLADALITAAEDHETAQEDHSTAAGDHQTAAADHSAATWDHQAIVDMIDLYEPITINGDVTNAPDEEDITSDENDLLKFKDRGVIYGMGYCILRRNKTFAEQLTKTNTIYEIRYDFTLTENVTIPVGCVLRFNGGSIGGAYTIIGQNTGLEAGLVKIFATDITIAGLWNVSEVYPEWFGAEKDDATTDSTPSIKKAEMFDAPIVFQNGSYYLSEYYISREGVTLFGNGSGHTAMTRFLPFSSNQKYIIKVGGGETVFGGSANKARRTNIKHIMFSNSNNKTIASGDVSNPWNCGLLCLDRVEVGSFDLYFSGVYDCPALFIGYSYELTFDNIICYSLHTKSDCPVIAFGSTGGDISCTKVHKLAIESFTGTAIKCLNSAGSISEFVIDTFFVEGTMAWEGGSSTTSVDDRYFMDDREAMGKVSEYNAITKIPLVDLNGLSIIYINTMFINALNGRWKNTKDNDNAYKTFSFAKLGSGTRGGMLKVRDLELWHCPFIYIEDNLNGSALLSVPKVSIDYINGDAGIMNSGDHNNNNFADSREMFNLNTYVKHVVGNAAYSATVEIGKHDYVTILPYDIIQGSSLYIDHSNLGYLTRNAVSNNNGGLKTSKVYVRTLSASYFDYLDAAKKAKLPEELISIPERIGENAIEDYPFLASNYLSEDTYKVHILGYTTNMQLMPIEVRYFSVSTGSENTSLRVRKNIYNNKENLIDISFDVPKQDGYTFNVYQVQQEYDSVHKYFCSLALAYIHIIRFPAISGSELPLDGIYGQCYNQDGTLKQYVGTWKNKVSSSLNRPTDNVPEGYSYFDTTLGKPIWWNGTAWIDATGEPVE